jgi:hypothetical protein
LGAEAQEDEGVVAEEEKEETKEVTVEPPRPAGDFIFCRNVTENLVPGEPVNGEKEMAELNTSLEPSWQQHSGSRGPGAPPPAASMAP